MLHKQVRMHYGQNGGRCCIWARQTLRFHSLGGSTFPAWNDVKAAILKLWRQIENLTPSVDVYLWTFLLNFIPPQPFWNDVALGYFNTVAPRRTRTRTTTTATTKKMSREMRSVPDLNFEAGIMLTYVILFDNSKLAASLSLTQREFTTSLIGGATYRMPTKSRRPWSRILWSPSGSRSASNLIDLFFALSSRPTALKIVRHIIRKERKERNHQLIRIGNKKQSYHIVSCSLLFLRAVGLLSVPFIAFFLPLSNSTCW